MRPPIVVPRVEAQRAGDPIEDHPVAANRLVLLLRMILKLGPSGCNPGVAGEDVVRRSRVSVRIKRGKSVNLSTKSSSEPLIHQDLGDAQEDGGVGEAGPHRSQ